MVLIVFVAVLMWALAQTAPDLYRRWSACSMVAERHATKARNHAALAASFTQLGNAKRAAIEQKVADWHREKMQKFRHALLIPWEFYSLGQTLDPYQDGDEVETYYLFYR
jgi:hypothetical protein